MARIILGSYMVRYPLGGMMSWVLQYLAGFRQLGHEVWFVEKAGYENACYDPERNVMGDDPTRGARAVHELLSRFGLGDRWCFVDIAGEYHGMPRGRIEAAFDSADAFIDMGTHGDWLGEAANTGCRVLLDGEPAFTQMKMENRLAAGEPAAEYDRYFTCGRNIGTERSSAPTAGRSWGTVFHPVVVDLFPAGPVPPGAPLTTVMNWQSYEPVHYRGKTYGHKDVEFEKFVGLPARTSTVLEVAVSGKGVPSERLRDAGWRIRDAHEVTSTFDSFARYVRESGGEFAVCKNGFVATRSGWFSDRSAVYLASGRPVVMQDTGFSDHLPCGEGLYAVGSVEEAAEAIERIRAHYRRESEAARKIACAHLDARKVLARFLNEIGI
ncbi:MAG: hypothetical protein ABIH26_00180 [Candidatus Eisenbacteria bacterium]